jgi:hypothetical protein
LGQKKTEIFLAKGLDRQITRSTKLSIQKIIERFAVQVDVAMLPVISHASFHIFQCAFSATFTFNLPQSKIASTT